jgi:hypothetical protein
MGALGHAVLEQGTNCPGKKDGQNQKQKATDETNE